MGTAEIGIWLAFAIGVCGSVGTFLGGYLVDKFGARDIRWYLWIPAVSFVISFPFALGLLFSSQKTTALLCYLMPNILYAFFLGPSIAMLQDMLEIKMRATASAVYNIILALFGGGMGPFIAGFISDQLEPIYAGDSIRWALFYISFLEVPAMLCYLQAAKTLRKDIVK
jgi:MFS family permease